MLLWRFSNLIHLFLFNLFIQAPIDGFSDDFWKSENFDGKSFKPKIINRTIIGQLSLNKKMVRVQLSF